MELLERGELVKDYNANMTNVDSEDEDDPRTPTSLTSQEGQGMDFVDVEAFTVIPDCALPELNLQVNGPALLSCVQTRQKMTAKRGYLLRTA